MNTVSNSTVASESDVLYIMTATTYCEGVHTVMACWGLSEGVVAVATGRDGCNAHHSPLDMPSDAPQGVVDSVVWEVAEGTSLDVEVHLLRVALQTCNSFNIHVYCVTFNTCLFTSQVVHVLPIYYSSTLG